jgi:LysM repeat protein
MDYKKQFLTVLLALTLAISIMGFAVQPAQAASCAFYHTVSSGESLSWIGSYYGVSWTTLAANNNIKSPYTIFVGQQICIPSGGRYNTYNGYYYPYTYYYPSTYYNYYYSRTTWDYRVIGVVKGQTVTIETYNFPDNVYFEVRIGCAYCGSALVKVTDMDSDRGGTFKQRFSIPSQFAGYSDLKISLIQAKKGTTVNRVFSNLYSTRR